jgi:hypothetical protein
MAKRHLLGGRLRAASIASLASGMVILCLLGLFFPALRDMVPAPQPPATSSPPVPPTIAPSMSATAVPSPSLFAPAGGDGHLDRPAGSTPTPPSDFP